MSLEGTYQADVRRRKDPERRRRQRQRRIERNVAYVASVKEGQPCADCGQVFPPCCMHFDHVRGDKRANIGQMATGGCSLDSIKAEIAKCELRCSICHCLRHNKIDPALIWQGT